VCGGKPINERTFGPVRLVLMGLDLIALPEARLQLTQLLQGDVYDRSSVPILDQMKKRLGPSLKARVIHGVPD